MNAMVAGMDLLISRTGLYPGVARTKKLCTRMPRKKRMLPFGRLRVNYAQHRFSRIIKIMELFLNRCVSYSNDSTFT